jgi:hypothetical protein
MNNSLFVVTAALCLKKHTHTHKTHTFVHVYPHVHLLKNIKLITPCDSVVGGPELIIVHKKHI